MVALAWDQQHLDRTQRIVQAWRTRDLVAGTTQVAALRQAIAGADWDTVQRHDDIEAAMAFDGVLPPESLSFAGQAAISRPLACQSTPEPVPGPISLSGTAGPATCGETGMVSSSSGRNSVRANRPDTATKSQGNLFFSGGHNGGQDTLWKSLSPLYKACYINSRYSPQGSLWRERPPEASVNRAPLRAPVNTGR